MQHILCTIKFLNRAWNSFFSITEYGVVSHDNNVLLIGGYCDDSVSSRIVRYSMESVTDSWEEVGNLQAVRGDHRAIANGDRFYVIGGNSDSTNPL